MPIPEQFIDELVARSEISDVVSSYVHLTRKGNNLWGLCPFHNEKTPSFSVSPDKQIYHCFGCGKGGGVISFIMEIENLPFPDAVRLLAQRAGLEVPDAGADDAGRKKRARALAANRDAARFYHDYLKGPGGARVRDYLAQRQVAPRTATRFGLGAAPEQWDALTRALTAKGYSKMELIDAGLAV
ncbi:MAG: DNA primase, partial [Flavonifractor sp.]|nr:DNA primase [Flavonifractor sp.]